MTERKVRVVEVLEALVGGTKKHVLDLCLGLDTDRFEVHALLSPLRDSDAEGTTRSLRSAGVRVTHIPMRRGIDPVRAAQCIAQVTRYLKQVRPDLLHAHSSIAGLVGRVAARRARTPGVVYTPHGFPFCMHSSRLGRASFLAVERGLARWTDRIIAVCEGEREIAVTSGVGQPDQCVVIENGIEFPPTPAIQRDEKLSVLALPTNAQVVLCVGDLRPQKGHRFAIRAMATVASLVPDAHLVIAGEGELRSELEAEATRAGVSDRVHLVGTRTDVPELLALCDVFCQPSLWEGCPYALIEAAGAGCSVVGSEIPGIADIVRDGETGWLAPAGDARALAECLVDALSLPVDARRRGDAAREFVRDRHSLERMIAQTAALYERLAGTD